MSLSLKVHPAQINRLLIWAGRLYLTSHAIPLSRTWKSEKKSECFLPYRFPLPWLLVQSQTAVVSREKTRFSLRRQRYFLRTNGIRHQARIWPNKFGIRGPYKHYWNGLKVVRCKCHCHGIKDTSHLVCGHAEVEQEESHNYLCRKGPQVKYKQVSVIKVAEEGWA